MKPAPAAVATAIASQSAELSGSLFVFTISVGLVNFFRGTLGCRDAIFPAGPSAEVNQLAALAAKRPVRVAGILGFFLAGRTFHERYKIPLLAEEGWMRRAKRGADGVVRPAEMFRRIDHQLRLRPIGL